MTLARKKMWLHVAGWQEEYVKRHRLTMRDGYAEVEVDFCEDCRHHGNIDGPDDVRHDALCPALLTSAERPMEADRMKVLKALFERASRLLGRTPERAHVVLRRLAEWVPEGTPDVRTPSRFREEVKDAPFLSEAYLYPLLGKEDARTLLALMRQVGEAVGYNEE